MRHMKRAAIWLLCITLSASIYATSQATLEQPGRGQEWLSWTAQQRTSYVYGLLDGYLTGFGDACSLADQLFDDGKAKRLGDEHGPGDFPSARCLVHRGKFAKAKTNDGVVDVSAYTDVVTELYRDHEDCRDLPFALALTSLGNKYSTSEQLYEMARKGELGSRWCNAARTPKP